MNNNRIIRWNGILAIGNLGGVDTGNKLDRILEQYLRPITGPHMIDAANTIRRATAIALAKPYLADRIARAMRSVERADYDKPECRNMALGHATLALQKISDSCTISAQRNCLFGDSSVIRETRRVQKRACSQESARQGRAVRLALVESTISSEDGTVRPENVYTLITGIFPSLVPALKIGVRG